MGKAIFVTIKVIIKSDLSIEDAIEEFSSECNYNFSSTEKVEVLDTEWVDTSL